MSIKAHYSQCHFGVKVPNFNKSESKFYQTYDQKDIVPGTTPKSLDLGQVALMMKQMSE